MDSIASSVATALPGSMRFLMLGLIVGSLLLFRRGALELWARRLLISLATLYWLLSAAPVADALHGTLAGHYRPLMRAAEAGDAQAVVVLSGGSDYYLVRGLQVHTLNESTALRVIEAARLYKLLGDPWVIASGRVPERDGPPSSAAMRKTLAELGVPAARILEESESQNTHQNALYLGPLLRRYKIKRFVLVTSPVHMARAERVFRAAGFDFVPSISADGSELPRTHSLPFWPRMSNLGTSEAAVREYAGLTYYRLRGRLSRH